ncbi:MAG: methyltransferase domain-containing protein [Solobacterium sp.]|nr:methyltransferase domain-containing protein [Solobacterium sp.]
MKLICPVCRKALKQNGREAVCENGHHFDYAKSGYLNLLMKQSKVHGDDAAMVKARTGFLNSGAYAFLKEHLTALSREFRPQVIADLGCGEGYYTAALEAEEKYGFDMSKDALKHAAKHDRSTAYCVASIFHLPMPDSSCDFVLTCFAPAACVEIERILKPGGVFVFVTPGKKHLFELKELLYETPYENKVTPLNMALPLIRTDEIRQPFDCSGEDLMNLFMMTPYAWRTAESGKEKLRRTLQMRILAEFVVRVYQKPF